MSLWEKFDEFADRATEFADKATDRARDLAAEHNDTIDEKLDKAATYLDTKTGGKYSGKIDTGVGRAKESLDRFAEQRTAPSADGTGSAGDTDGGSTAAGEQKSDG